MAEGMVFAGEVCTNPGQSVVRSSWCEWEHGWEAVELEEGAWEKQQMRLRQGEQGPVWQAKGYGSYIIGATGSRLQCGET